METERKVLRSFCSFKYGKMPDKKRVSDNTSLYPIFSGYRVVGYYDEFNISEGELIVVARGVGGTGDVKLTPAKCYLTNLSIAIDVDETFALKQYLYYFFQISNLRYLDSGSAQSQITISDLQKVKVPLPPLEIQRNTVATMRVLDDKIDNNKAINRHLEQIAQAIFKSWFLDFELWGGERPTDWKDGCFSDVASITSGKRPPSRQATTSSEFDIPLIGASSIMGFTNAFLYNEKILITGRVGTHGVIQRYSRPFWASDNTLVIKSDYYEFTYQQLCGIDFYNMNRGSTQPLITRTDLKNIPIVLPDQFTLIRFEKLVGSLMMWFDNCILENEHLATLRDTLLPRLMSGELSVTDIDKHRN
jgi:type I restriction enzyme S subunit